MTPSISTTTKKKQEEAYPLHDLAKVLNNRAVHVITTSGNYEEGINLFKKALKLTKRSIVLKSGGDKNQVPCSCKFCSLESCLVLSEERKRQHPSSVCSSSPSTRIDIVVVVDVDVDDDDDGDGDGDGDGFSIQESHATKTKDDNINSSSVEVPMDYDDDLHDNTTHSPTSTNCPQQHESTNYCNTSSSHYQKENAVEKDNESGFVYQRFLLIDDHSIDENHYMGSTLSLVIIFNLALSHHLMGIDNSNYNRESLSSLSNPIDVTKKTIPLQHAVKLYELAYQLHSNYTDQKSVHTDNNNNNTMNIDNDDDDDQNNNDNHNRAVAHTVASLRFIMIISNNIGQIHRVAGNTTKYTRCLQHLLSLIMYVVGQQQLAVVPNTVFNSIELDGLIRNVSPIIFCGSICASAA